MNIISHGSSSSSSQGQEGPADDDAGFELVRPRGSSRGDEGNVCRFFTKGQCKLGSACPYRHEGAPTKHFRKDREMLPSMASQIPAGSPAQTVVQQVSKYGRRPLIQVVVIYASNQKVMGYAQKVADKLMECGIDVTFQTTPTGEPKVKGRTNDITTDHMAEIIVSSHADFLVVIGDRNMKNKSVHSKRKGKLIEMKIPDMQLLIWKSWPQNPHKNWARIEQLTVDQIEDLLFQYTGLKGLNERVESLREAADQLASGQAKKGRQNQNSEATQALNNFDLMSTRLHKQVTKAYSTVGAFIQAPENLEGSKGGMQPKTYKPNAPRTPQNTMAAILQFKLLQYLEAVMKEVEENCALLCSESLTNWDAAFNEHKATWKPIKVYVPPPPPPELNDSPANLPSYRDEGEYQGPPKPMRYLAFNSNSQYPHHSYTETEYNEDDEWEEEEEEMGEDWGDYEENDLGYNGPTCLNWSTPEGQVLSDPSQVKVRSGQVPALISDLTLDLAPVESSWHQRPIIRSQVILPPSAFPPLSTAYSSTASTAAPHTHVRPQNSISSSSSGPQWNRSLGALPTKLLVPSSTPSSSSSSTQKPLDDFEESSSSIASPDTDHLSFATSFKVGSTSTQISSRNSTPIKSNHLYPNSAAPSPSHPSAELGESSSSSSLSRSSSPSLSSKQGSSSPSLYTSTPPQREVSRFSFTEQTGSTSSADLNPSSDPMAGFDLDSDFFTLPDPALPRQSLALPALPPTRQTATDQSSLPVVFRTSAALPPPPVAIMPRSVIQTGAIRHPIGLVQAAPKTIEAPPGFGSDPVKVKRPSPIGPPQAAVLPPVPVKETPLATLRWGRLNPPTPEVIRQQLTQQPEQYRLIESIWKEPLWHLDPESSSPPSPNGGVQQPFNPTFGVSTSSTPSSLFSFEGQALNGAKGSGAFPLQFGSSGSESGFTFMNNSSSSSKGPASNGSNSSNGKTYSFF